MWLTVDGISFLCYAKLPVCHCNNIQQESNSAWPKRSLDIRTNQGPRVRWNLYFLYGASIFLKLIALHHTFYQGRLDGVACVLRALLPVIALYFQCPGNAPTAPILAVPVQNLREEEGDVNHLCYDGATNGS